MKNKLDLLPSLITMKTNINNMLLSSISRQMGRETSLELLGRHYELDLRGNISSCDGIDWYFVEAQNIRKMAKNYGITFYYLAGIVAAMSPRCPWERNIIAALEVCGFMVHPEGKQPGTSANVAKGKRILAGEDVETVLTTRKVSNFYKCLISGGTFGICIDTHAIDVALGIGYTSNATEQDIKVLVFRHPELYDAIAEAYYQVASEINALKLKTNDGNSISLTAAQLQALTWVEVRKLKKGI
jgi:hypothetical protein